MSASGRYGALRRAARATRPRWRGLALSVALGTGAVLAAVGLLTTSGYLISRAAERPEILSLTVAIVGVRFFGILRALLRYLERLVSHDLAFRTLAELRLRFFDRLVPLVPGALPGRSRAELLSRFVADVDRLQDLYLRALGPPLVALAAGLGAVAIAVLMHPPAALVIAAFLLAAGLAVPALAHRAGRAAGRDQASARAELTAGMVEIVDGAAEIALAGREREWLQRAQRSGQRLSRLQARDALAGGLAVGLGGWLAAAASVAVVAVAIPAVHGGALAGVLLAALALLVVASFESVLPLGAAATSVDACADAAARLEDVTARRAAVCDPRQPLPLPLGGDLVAEGLRFRYDAAGPWVLDGVDLRLQPGTATALVGPSGVGKTTLAELLVRFLEPNAGAIALGGADIAAAEQEELRSRVRLLGQDAHLFAASVRQNLAIARPDASDAEMTRALARVGLGPWLGSLPAGLDTPVGERGALISGGQRQRLAAARGLVSDAPFLIFDEPTAHLDEDGARELLGELAALSRRRRRAVLVISHEPDGFEGFGQVLALRGGRLVGLRGPAR